jgi:uncharacterized protein with FMN-binding domain
VRPGTGVAVGLASCAALVATWRLGAAPHPGTVQGLTVVAPPSATAGAGASTSSAAPTTTKHRTSTTHPSAPTPSGPRSFDGATVGTQFGNVQVRIVVNGGHLVDVTALRLTDSSGRSVSISAQAAPILRREALAAGSAQIDSVSGASYTSAAYIQSLQSALDTARAAG